MSPNKLFQKSRGIPFLLRAQDTQNNNKPSQEFKIEQINDKLS